MDVFVKKFKYGKNEITLETGRIARQATGAVLVSMDNTSVMCTVVGAKEAKPEDLRTVRVWRPLHGKVQARAPAAEPSGRSHPRGREMGGVLRPVAVPDHAAAVPGAQYSGGRRNALFSKLERARGRAEEEGKRNEGTLRRDVRGQRTANL